MYPPRRSGGREVLPMYVDKKKKRWPGLLWILAGAAAVALLWCLAVPVSGEDMSEESARAVKAAVDRCALQCYVVEGLIPQPGISGGKLRAPDQREEFFVSYEIFASNVPPTVKVIRRN